MWPSPAANRALKQLLGRCRGLGHAAAAAPVRLQPRQQFRPRRVAVVTKTTRYEFEQQRYRYAGLSEEDLKQLLAVKGSSYSGLLERHNIHTSNVEHVVRSLRDKKVEVRVVKRGEYDQGVVAWADAIVSAGGDGTMLLVASKVLSKDKPVVGVNTDPERSQGHLCLPVRYTRAFPEALEKLARGEFRWLWRQRIRLHLEGTGINPTPVDLHEQQLSLEQHSRAHRITTLQHRGPAEKSSEPRLLPVRGLNEIFIGESLSSRASYYEISVDGGPWEKQKSSGLSICTGTGSKAWSYNINKLGEQAVEEILTTGQSQAGTQLPLDRSFIQEGGPPPWRPPAGAGARLLSFLCVCVCVRSDGALQRVPGLPSGRRPSALQREGAHRQQSLLQQPPERLRQQAVCALALLGRLHGGGRGDVLRVQRRRHRHHQHQRGRPPAHGGSGRLRPGHLTPPSPAGGGGPGPAGAGRDQDQSGSSSWVT